MDAADVFVWRASLYNLVALGQILYSTPGRVTDGRPWILAPPV